MRIAIVGLPGSGQTSLAGEIAEGLAAPAVTSIEELRGLVRAGRDFVLDGLPRSVAEFREIEALGSGAPVLDRVVLLEADADVRARRMRHNLVEADREPGLPSDAALTDELAELDDVLRERDLILPISANGGVYKVMALACEALGLRI